MNMYPEDMQSQQQISEAAFEARLTRALEQTPEAYVPSDFATRVSAALPAPRAVREPLRWTRKVAAAAILVLAASMFALAPHAAPTFGNLAFDAELMVILQLGGIAYWLTVGKKV